MNETKPQNQMGQHQRERKQYFQRLKDWRKKYLGAAWQDTKIAARKGKFWFELLALLALIAYTTLNGFLWWETKNAVEWTRNQTKDIFNDHRPFIWIKVPDSIPIQAGKPIRPDVQIFNYGKFPGIARARIRFEAAPGVIERFRDILRNHPDEFSLPQDQTGMLKLLILPGTGRYFPIETPELVLSKQDMDKLAAGNIDVAIYGRIFYTDLNNAANGHRDDAYQSIFCFYVMRDGTTTSACPNRYTNREEYTNWAP